VRVACLQTKPKETIDSALCEAIELAKIAVNKKNSNLFKAEVYTKNIERAYKKVYQNYLDGIKPQNFEL